MPSAKRNDDDHATEVVEEPVSGTGVVDTSGWVEVPNNSARPADHPVGNTTFADRAKAQGSNKRVESGEGK